MDFGNGHMQPVTAGFGRRRHRPRASARRRRTGPRGRAATGRACRICAALARNSHRLPFGQLRLVVGQGRDAAPNHLVENVSRFVLNVPLAGASCYDRRDLKGIEMSGRTCLTIVLAAGEGTRMRSSRPKVLHEVAGRSLLGHVLTPCARPATRRSPSWSAPSMTMFRPMRARLRRTPQVFVQARAARNRACGAGGARPRSKKAPTTSW